MSNLDSSLNQTNITRSTFAHALSLSDDDADTLLKDGISAIPKLMKNNSLTEVGNALIRLDTLSSFSQTTASSECPDGWIKVNLPPPLPSPVCLPPVNRPKE